MRLLTKDWYRTMGDSGLGVMLQVDERAGEASETVYQTIRAEKLEKWLLERKELCELTEEAFDPETEKRLFEEYVDGELRCYETRLPPAIRLKVADIRVLALGACTGEVFRALEEYRAWCEKWTEKTLEEAENMRIHQGLEHAWTGEHSLHDSFVRSVKQEGEDLVVEFEREDPMERLRDIRENDPELLEELGEETFLFPEIKAVRFRNARILKQEQPAQNSWWLYDEIWHDGEGGYEIHALLWRDREVFELTVGCRETELVWTVLPKVD